MRAYRNDHSKLPERLEDLVPDYMNKVPSDPYDGQKIRYIKDRHILYSVGKNLSDDGGSGKEIDSDWRPTRWTAEDITFSIGPSGNQAGR